MAAIPDHSTVGELDPSTELRVPKWFKTRTPKGGDPAIDVQM